MNKQTYKFNELGTIAGVPGQFHTGQEVDVDLDTMTVLEVRLSAPPEKVKQLAPQEHAPAAKKSAGVVKKAEGV